MLALPSEFPRATRLFVGLAPTANLCVPFALSATLYFPALNFLSATSSQSIGFRKLATATLSSFNCQFMGKVTNSSVNVVIVASIISPFHFCVAVCLFSARANNSGVSSSVVCEKPSIKIGLPTTVVDD
jgi:hypothetical protein